MKHFAKVRTPGEAFVWFTSMGLTAGLLMVISLLFLIMINGAKVFWPPRLTQIQMKDGTSVAGAVLKKQKQKTAEAAVEWQLFVGNKDQYGQGFRFINEKDVAKTQDPLNIIRI